MKKFYTIFCSLCLLSAIQSQAQQTIQKIPQDIKMLAEINFKKLTSLMPVKDWDKSEVGKELLKYSYESSGKKLKSIADLGVDLNSSLYFYLSENDSIKFYNILMPLADARKTKNLYAKQDILSLGNDRWMVIDKDSSALQMWDNQHLLYVKATARDEYFEKPEVAQNHGITLYNPYDFGIVTDTAIALLDTSEIIFDEEVIPDTTIEIEEEIVIESPDTEMPDQYDDSESEESAEGIDHVYFKNREIKKRIAVESAKDYMVYFFNKTGENSILNNPHYQNAKNDAAVASFFIDNPIDLYRTMSPFSKAIPSMGMGEKKADNAMYESFSSHLLFDEKQININTGITMSPEIAQIQKEMLDRKLNPKFLNYVQMNHMLGYIGYAMNTKNYLKNYPQLLEKTWTNIAGIEKDEMMLGLEFLSFLIDEEAISNLLPGDALFLLNGLYQQEVSYTEYTYDEEYNMTPITKTKNETLPKFLFMVSSEENKLTDRLIKYGAKKEFITETGDYYTVKLPHSPMNTFFGFKDGIWFFTNEEKDMKAISNGSFKANISEAEKQQMTDPNFSAYFNPKQIEKEIASAGFELTTDMTDFLNKLKKMNVVRFRSLPIQNNKITTELLMEVPKGNKNGLVYFMDFMNEIMKK